MGNNDNSVLLVPCFDVIDLSHLDVLTNHLTRFETTLKVLNKTTTLQYKLFSTKHIEYIYNGSAVWYSQKK